MYAGVGICGTDTDGLLVALVAAVYVVLVLYIGLEGDAVALSEKPGMLSLEVDVPLSTCPAKCFGQVPFKPQSMQYSNIPSPGILATAIAFPGQRSCASDGSPSRYASMLSLTFGWKIHFDLECSSSAVVNIGSLARFCTCFLLSNLRPHFLKG